MKTKTLILLLFLCAYSAIQGQTKTFSGYDNDGTKAALKIKSGPQTMLIDGNEIDAVNTPLYLNDNSTHSVLIAGAGGNVGIGNSATSRFSIQQIHNNANGGIKIVNSGQDRELNLFVDGSNRSRIESAGNGSAPLVFNSGGGEVGIGVTAPASLLHLKQTTDDFNGGLKIVNSGNNRQFNIFVDDANRSHIESADDGSAPLILNSGGGKVGIGTADPQKLFEVSTGFAMWDNAIVRIKGAHNPTLDIHSTNNWHPRLRLLTNDGADAWEMHAAGSLSNRSLVFAYNETNFFNITKNGNVGIGTDSPVSRLQVKQFTNDSDGGIKIVNSGNNRQFNLFVDDSNNSRIESSDGSASLILNSGSGKVGIGTTSPSEKLEVSGTVKATSFVSSTASFPDYVFATGYRITPLSELETYVTTHKHLPNMPSEKEVVEKGLNLPEVVTKSVENIEVIYLHLIRMEKKIEALEQENNALKQQLKQGR